MVSLSRAFIYNPWFIWCFTTLTVLLQFLLQTSVSVMIPNLREAFNANVLGVSLISASFFYTYVFLQMPAGMLFDRFPAKNIFAIGIIGVSIACLIFAKANIITIAIISRLLMGAFCAIAFPGSLYLASNLFPPQCFALIVGMTEMFGMLGAAFGERFLAFCIEHYGWRQSILFCAIFAFLLAISLYIIIAKGLNGKLKQNEVNSQQASVFNKLLVVIKCPQAWLCGIFSGLMFVVITSFASLWCVTYLEKIYQVGLSEAATAGALMFLGAAIGNPLFGWLSDWVGRRKPILLFSAVLTLLLLFITFYLPDVSFFAVNILMFSLGFACCGYSLPFAIARDITPLQCRGAMMGFINMLSLVVGAPILQPIIGWLLNKQQAVHSTGQALTLTADVYRHVIGNSLLTCIVIALIIGLAIKETYCREMTLSQK